MQPNYAVESLWDHRRHYARILRDPESDLAVTGLMTSNSTSARLIRTSSGYEIGPHCQVHAYVHNIVSDNVMAESRKGRERSVPCIGSVKIPRIVTTACHSSLDICLSIWFMCSSE